MLGPLMEMLDERHTLRNSNGNRQVGECNLLILEDSAVRSGTL
jgi:hypothetical protein